MNALVKFLFSIYFRNHGRSRRYEKGSSREQAKSADEEKNEKIV